MEFQKRILVITNMYPSDKYPEYGIFVKRIVDGIRRHKVKVSLVSLKKVSGVLKLFSYIIFYIRSFVLYIVGGEDVVYAHYISHVSVPIILANIFRKRFLVLNAHGSDLYLDNLSGFKRKVKFWLCRKSLNLSNLVVCPSEDYAQEMLVEIYDVPQRKILISPSGGVDLNIFKNKIGISHGNEKRMLYVGRINHEKGVFDLLDALVLGEWSTMLKIDIIGNGGEKALSFLSSKIATANSKKNVFVRYFPSMNHCELSEFYSSADAFIFPSKRESLGLVGIEAMACGLPVVGSNIAGIRSYLIDNYNGILFEPGHPESLLKAVQSYLSLENKKVEAMSGNAVKTASTYNEKCVIESLLDNIFVGDR
ncbi:glycosyltransferase family 4 protein [Kushneria phosphatilytica]|uniref:Glycosyltransferase family 4 protein n=1 Tax=Kushneria phosphatilytica TaxID=657387 RepID=A0A5C1A0X8_9GAMM|nr:glycosyltransferase family 4 protein [Kushneria phosphatilytica]QEL11798.1 glycosyltransferase family 4 protein [Kushneria phosphatilytica]